MSWMLQPAYASPCCAMPRSASRRVVRCSAAPAKLEVRVLVSSDGRLVCPDLPAGVYTVSSWWAGQGVRNEKALPSAPGCDVSRSRDCGVFCTLNEAGDLVRFSCAPASPFGLLAESLTRCNEPALAAQVCEGLMEGEYTVLNADPATQVRAGAARNAASMTSCCAILTASPPPAVCVSAPWPRTEPRTARARRRSWTWRRRQCWRQRRPTKRRAPLAAKAQAGRSHVIIEYKHSPWQSTIARLDRAQHELLYTLSSVDTSV
jgi:hypothetical protein